MNEPKRLRPASQIAVPQRIEGDALATPNHLLGTDILRTIGHYRESAVKSQIDALLAQVDRVAASEAVH